MSHGLSVLSIGIGNFSASWPTPPGCGASLELGVGLKQGLVEEKQKQARGSLSLMPLPPWAHRGRCQASLGHHQILPIPSWHTSVAEGCPTDQRPPLCSKPSYRWQEAHIWEHSDLEVVMAANGSCGTLIILEFFPTLLTEICPVISSILPMAAPSSRAFHLILEVGICIIFNSTNSKERS